MVRAVVPARGLGLGAPFGPEGPPRGSCLAGGPSTTGALGEIQRAGVDDRL